jgi:hypothetical protein
MQTITQQRIRIGNYEIVETETGHDVISLVDGMNVGEFVSGLANAVLYVVSLIMDDMQEESSGAYKRNWNKLATLLY